MHLYPENNSNKIWILVTAELNSPAKAGLTITFIELKIQFSKA